MTIVERYAEQAKITNFLNPSQGQTNIICMESTYLCKHF